VDGGDFNSIPNVRRSHWANPVKDSWLSERTQQPANLLGPEDYPVAAECQICHGRIRLNHKLQWEWRHAPVVTAAPAPPAGDTA
jgi:hypothetical protein